MKFTRKSPLNAMLMELLKSAFLKNYFRHTIRVECQSVWEPYLAGPPSSESKLFAKVINR